MWLLSCVASIVFLVLLILDALLDVLFVLLDGVY